VRNAEDLYNKFLKSFNKITTAEKMHTCREKWQKSFEKEMV